MLSLVAHLVIEVLVLQAERLVCAIRYSGFFFQTTLARIVKELQGVAVFIGHLSWDADWVAVEVVGCWPFSPSSLI